MRYVVLACLVIAVLPAAAATAPSDYTWSTAPASGGVQDGFCYEDVDPDNDIDCAGASNWCESRTANRACNEASDAWLCDGGTWACDNGVRKNPNASNRCEPLYLEAQGCYSVYEGTYTCYSDGESQWAPSKPGGCTCERDYECMRGVCQAGTCLTYVAPSITIGDVRDTATLPIGNQLQFNTTIGNPLSQPDNITVRFKGRALREGYVSIDVIETEQVTCSPGSRVCNISIPAKSNAAFFVNLEGISYGSGSLVIEAVSRSTQLTAQNSMLMTVEAIGQSQQRRAPGTTLPYLVALIIGAALVLGRLQRKKI